MGRIQPNLKPGGVLGGIVGSDLYFLFAKVAGWLLTPSALFMAAVMLGFLLLLMRPGTRAGERLSQLGRRLIGLALLGYVAVAMLPVGQWALGKLEDRFPASAHSSEPVAGIVVLGGSIDTVLTRERGQVSVSSSVERLIEFIRLARVHPQAKLVFSGGNGRVFDVKPSEAEVAQAFFRDVGFDDARVHYEDRSRNTAESARLSYEQFTPKADERWLLVTSARHMPRAMGLFRHAGWPVVAHPVDYQLRPNAPTNWWPRWPGRIDYADVAAYEWGGLIVARLRGRIDSIFPQP